MNPAVQLEGREALAYVKGMEAASQLSPEERTRHLLVRLTELVTQLAQEVDALRQRQDELERRIGTSDSTMPAAAATVSAHLAGERTRLRCPLCQKPLPVDEETWSRERFEVSCPDCQVTLEVR